MKRLLILSYHFRPLNAIASLRANAFADHLHHHGIRPIIVTHDWQETAPEHWQVRQGDASIHTHFETHEVLRLPLPPAANSPAGSRLKSALCMLKGQFDLGAWLPESRAAYAAFLASNHEALGGLDGVLAIYNPHHHLELGWSFAQERGLPYCADLRDLWSPDAETGKPPTGLGARFKEAQMRRHWKRWLSDAAVLSTVSPPLANTLETWLNRPAITVRNGVEQGLFDGIEALPQTRFTVAHVGTLYAQQPLDGLGAAMQRFEENGGELVFRWIGLRQQDQANRVKQLWAEFGLQSTLEIVSRVSRQEALEEMRNAHALFYPTWPNRPGIVSGKIYEYLASGTPILATADSEGMDVVGLIKRSPVGFSFGPGEADSMAMRLGGLQKSMMDKQPTFFLRETEVERWAEAFAEAVYTRL